jgi:PhnB protein
VCVDDSVIMISDASSAYPANEVLLHVYVPDVHTTFNTAIELGCEVVERPVNKDGDPDTRGSFKDFAGNIWAVGTQKSS